MDARFVFVLIVYLCYVRYLEQMTQTPGDEGKD